MWLLPFSLRVTIYGFSPENRTTFDFITHSSYRFRSAKIHLAAWQSNLMPLGDITQIIPELTLRYAEIYNCYLL